jgi:hypothetical protein
MLVTGAIGKSAGRSSRLGALIAAPADHLELPDDAPD